MIFNKLEKSSHHHMQVNHSEKVLGLLMIKAKNKNKRRKISQNKKKKNTITWVHYKKMKYLNSVESTVKIIIHIIIHKLRNLEKIYLKKLNY